MAKNRDLIKAKEQKKDEFYTQLTDIEKEMKHYTAHFRGKTIFLNCDDPEYSNFWLYFQLNFYQLGLKKLISTHYEENKPSYKMEIVSTNKDDGQAGTQLGIPDYVKTPLKQNGDFRSPECIEILKEADIVITNPPFSLFREFVAQLMEYDKKFIIIGNQNAIHYKEIFPLLRDNKMWIGVSIHSGDREFQVPDDYPLQASGWRVDEEGRKYIRVKGIRWFTNLDFEERHEDMLLYKSYCESEYPKYINYDAIEVNKTADIPCDYYGDMGVPDNFMDKYNPEQFVIVGLAEGELGKEIGFSANLTEEECKALSREYKPFRKGNPIYRKNDGTLHKPFARIIIRRKEQN